MSSPDDDDDSAQTEQTAVVERGPDEEPAPEPADVPEAQPAPATEPAPESRVRVRDVAKAGDEVWASIGQVAAAVAACAGFVYLIGGLVMWLRFREADLPADQAVALMSKEQLLVVGLRLMVLPAAVIGALAWIATARTEPAQPGDDRSVFAMIRDWFRAASVRKLVLLAVVVVLALALLLGLPATWASLGWALAAVMVCGCRWYQVKHPGNARRERLAIALVAVAAAGVVSLARQLDQPVQLLSAQVLLDDSTTRNGVFVSSSSDDIFVGDTVGHKLVDLPRAHVTSVTVGPPEERAPRESVLSLILGGNDFSITPFEWWCNGERYSWGELGDLCRTQVQLLDASRVLDSEHPSYAPVRVRCPLRATSGCTGYLRLVSRKLFQVTPSSVPKHVVIGPVPLRLVGAKSGNTIGSGVTGYVCPEVPANTRGVLRNVPAQGEAKPTPTVQFQLVVTSDAAGHDVVRRTNYALTTPPTGETIPRLQGCSG
jgi:hypothetical protein